MVYILFHTMKLLIFCLLFIDSIDFTNSCYHLLILVIIYPFPLPVTVLDIISSYLLWRVHNKKWQLRQAIYYIFLSNTGGTWAGNHRCSLLFWLCSTIAHLVLIRLRGSVYYSCSQHLNRTGSSYQSIITDLALIKIIVQLLQHSNITVNIPLIML